MAKAKSKKIDVSVVVPMMNEEENAPILHEKIHLAMDAWDREYEIIIVDDGSTDRTFEILKNLAENDPHLKVIKFLGNYGQSAAMAAGFEYATGEVIVTMDGDLQNDPKDIPVVVEKLHEGFDVVSGWRKNRKDKLIIRKIPSKIANYLVRRTTRVSLHDTGCSLKAYRKDLVKNIRLYGEFHRFIPALGRIEGARITEMVVDHHERQFGESKYNITRTFRVIMDLTTLNLLLKHLTNPVHFFGALTLIFNGIGFLSLLGFFVAWITKTLSPDEMNIQASLILLMLAAGANFLFFGLIAETVVRTGEKRDERMFDVTQY
ncbi:MAG: glycosyltransferase [Calditrichaeota bacterium]|nr:MAG: glycosyltransferase [Calditrichota bacterium]